MLLETVSEPVILFYFTYRILNIKREKERFVHVLCHEITSIDLCLNSLKLNFKQYN